MFPVGVPEIQEGVPEAGKLIQEKIHEVVSGMAPVVLGAVPGMVREEFPV